MIDRASNVGNGASPAYGVTDSYVVATATRADMTVMSGHINPI